MTGMETPGDDALEQRQPVDDPAAAAAGAAALDPEVPEADAAEQHTPVRPEEEDEPRFVPGEANEADAAEQAVTVEMDEDDYR